MDPAIVGATPAWVLGCSVGLAWTAAAAGAALFALIGRVLDAPVGARPGSGAILGMVLSVVVAAGCTGAGTWLSAWAASETERRLRRAVVGRVFDLGVARTAGRSGDLLSLATDAVERTAHYRAAFLGPIVGALTTPLLVLVVMALTVDPVTAAWLAVLILLVPLLVGGFQRLVRPIGGAYRRTQARLTAAFLEALQALDTLVYARAADRAGARLAQRGQEHRRGLMRLLAGNQLLILVVDAAFSLSVVVAAAAIAVSRIADGRLRLGDGIAILLMTSLVIGPVDVVGQFFYIGIAGRATQRRLGAHLTDARRPADAPPAGPGQGPSRRSAVHGAGGVDGAAAADGGAARRNGAIVLEDVTAGWPGGPPVLHGLSLQVEPGEKVALVGPSGVGKSTLAALLQCHLTPRAGRAVVDGLDLADADPDEVRSRLAVVEQRTFLFLGTIADNLRVADPGADDARLWQALDLAGLRTEVRSMPQELATPVGEHGVLLSGGQAQRLAVARAFLRDAPIVILDEPTSQVDLAGESALLAALDRLTVGRTVLMIAHRPGAVLAADRVVSLTPTSARAAAPAHAQAAAPAYGQAAAHAQTGCRTGPGAERGDVHRGRDEVGSE